MRFKTVIRLSLVLAAASVTSASAWDIAPCSTEHRSAWKEYEQKLRSTTDPEAPDYVPHPFPKTVQQAWEDFLSYHRRAFRDTPRAELRPTERRFFEVVDTGRAQVTGRRVINWSHSRCTPQRERSFYFLLNVKDETTGVEITRIAIDESGLVHSLIHRPLEEEHSALPKPVQDLEEAAQKGRSILGAQPRDAQYVAATGTLRCDVLLPCVAFRDNGRAYVHHAERGLFRLERDRGVMSLGGGQGERLPRDAAMDLRARNEHLLSIHAGSWLAAVPVEP